MVASGAWKLSELALWLPLLEVSVQSPCRKDWLSFGALVEMAVRSFDTTG